MKYNFYTKCIFRTPPKFKISRNLMIKSNHKYSKRYYLPIIFSLLYKQSTYQCQKQTKKDKSTANCVMMQLIFDWLFLHSMDSCHHSMVDVEKNVVSLCLILQVNVSFLLDDELYALFLSDVDAISTAHIVRFYFYYTPKQL